MYFTFTTVILWLTHVSPTKASVAHAAKDRIAVDGVDERSTSGGGALGKLILRVEHLRLRFEVPGDDPARECCGEPVPDRAVLQRVDRRMARQVVQCRVVFRRVEQPTHVRGATDGDQRSVGRDRTTIIVIVVRS
jgi:hypothetical protein